MTDFDDEGKRAATAEIMRLLAVRGPGKSICPSEAARAMSAAGWRPLMPLVRSAAIDLAEAGDIVVLQAGSMRGRRRGRSA